MNLSLQRYGNFYALRPLALTYFMLALRPRGWNYVDSFPKLMQREWKDWWAVQPSQRCSLTCQLNAVIAYFFGLDGEDFRYILREKRDNPKGFWRVDKSFPRKFRHPFLTLQVFLCLLKMGINDFITDEWELPEPLKFFMIFPKKIGNSAKRAHGTIVKK